MEGLGFILHLLFLDILVAPPQILVWIYVLVQSVFGDVFTGALCMLLYVTKMSGVQPGPPLCCIVCAPASAWRRRSSSIYITSQPEQG